MRFCGKVYKDGKFWLAEVPILDAMTQGRTRKEAFEMVADLLESLADRPEFEVQVHPGKNGELEIESSDIKGMIALLLRRQREQSGLSLSEIRARLGAKSSSAYSRYERGKSAPDLEKLSELLKVVSPNLDIVLNKSLVM